MYSDIKTKITTLITGITGIKNVYGYEKGNLDGYPSAVITCESIDSEYLTNNENERKYTFKVRVYQEMDADAAGALEAESRVEAMIDDIIKAFENDWTLSGSCHKVFVKGIMAYADRGISTRVIEATIECYTLITLT